MCVKGGGGVRITLSLSCHLSTCPSFCFVMMSSEQLNFLCLVCVFVEKSSCPSLASYM